MSENLKIYLPNINCDVFTRIQDILLEPSNLYTKFSDKKIVLMDNFMS